MPVQIPYIENHIFFQQSWFVLKWSVVRAYEKENSEYGSPLTRDHTNNGKGFVSRPWGQILSRSPLDSSMLCSNSFWHLLWRRRFQTLLYSTFLLDHIGGVDRGYLLHGKLLISRKTLYRPAPWRGYSSVAFLLQENGKQQSTQGRIPMALLYREVDNSRERHCLRIKDVSKCDMSAMDMDIDNWEEVAKNRLHWRHDLCQELKKEETEACYQWEAYSNEKRQQQRTKQKKTKQDNC